MYKTTVGYLLVVSWPKGIKERGVVRSQFGHATDIAPTIFELAGVSFSAKGGGRGSAAPVGPEPCRQLHPGRCFVAAYPAVFRDSRHPWHLQGWLVGWFAAGQSGGNSALNKAPFGTRQWELYNLDEDFSQSRNLADQYPENSPSWWRLSTTRSLA